MISAHPVLKVSTNIWESQMSKKLLIGVSALVLITGMSGLAIARHGGHDGHKSHYCGKGGKHHGWHRGHRGKHGWRRGHHGKRWGHKFGGASIMKNADADKDGVITKAELEAASEKKFAEFDKDKNGEVTKEEVLAKIASHLEKRAARLTRRFDINQDGKVTTEEFNTFAGRKLYMFDLNDDGKIDKSEMPRHMRHAGKRAHKGKKGDKAVMPETQETEKAPEVEDDQQ